MNEGQKTDVSSEMKTEEKPVKAKGQLTVLARGRFCNKLRVLLTALHAARQTNRDLFVGWTPNPGCNMKFEDFFEPLKGVQFAADERKLADQVFNVSATVGRRDDVKHWDVGQNLLAISCGAIVCGSMGNAIAVRRVRGELIPREMISSAVDEYAKKHFADGPIVGLHIRALEHFKEITPLAKYVTLVEQMPPNVKVYLATDSQEAADLMLGKFKDKVLYRKKTLGSDTKDGMRDAIIDLYLLNRCKHLCGTKTSSYNSMASVIKDEIPLVVL